MIDTCKFGNLYSEYVKETKFEKFYDPHGSYNPIICCHKNAPYVMFEGVVDNFLCEKAIGSNKCPIHRKPGD